MKNPVKEKQRMSQKHHGHGRRKGFQTYYDYSYRSENHTLTWYDDLYFWLNGIRYFVAFVHSRMAYKDECSEIVWDKLYPSRPDNQKKFIPYKTKKLGKSRKKTILYQWEDNNKEELDIWHQKLWIEEDVFPRISDVCITPSVSVEWLQRSKMIKLCVPYEILSEESALFFADMVKNHYKSGTLYEWVAKMKTLKYTKDDWNKEQNSA